MMGAAQPSIEAGVSDADLARRMASALRMLAVDAVENARSRHPGAPIMACVLWARHLKHYPANPKWFDRDRFVLSNGHGSMLLSG
jgi:transketolase